MGSKRPERPDEANAAEAIFRILGCTPEYEETGQSGLPDYRLQFPDERDGVLEVSRITDRRLHQARFEFGKRSIDSEGPLDHMTAWPLQKASCCWALVLGPEIRLRDFDPSLVDRLLATLEEDGVDWIFTHTVDHPMTKAERELIDHGVLSGRRFDDPGDHEGHTPVVRLGLGVPGGAFDCADWLEQAVVHECESNREKLEPYSCGHLWLWADEYTLAASIITVSLCEKDLERSTPSLPEWIDTVWVAYEPDMSDSKFVAFRVWSARPGQPWQLVTTQV